MKKIIILPLAALMLSGCGVLKNYDRDKVVGEVKTDGLYGDAQSGDSLGIGDVKWRSFFTDPQLQALIEKALAQNTDIRNSALQIQQMKYVFSASKTAFIPNITFSPQGAVSTLTDPYHRQDNSTNETYGLALSLGWQNYNFLDMINQVKGAKENRNRIENARQAIQVAIVANVAQMYYSLAQLDQTLEVVTQTQDNWKKFVEMQRLLMNAGQANEAAVASYEATYYNICQSIVTINSNITLLENSLCKLLGQMPGTLQAFHSAQVLDRFRAPGIISTGAPVSILSRRPDVRDAEFALKDAFYKKNQAIANFYPKITLSASGSFTNSAGYMIMNPGVIMHNFVASIVQPVFAGGVLRTKYKVAKVDQEIAVNNFVQKVIDAGNEVNSAMVNVRSAEELSVLIAQQVEALQRAYDATNLLYQHSGANYLNVITAHNSLLQGKTSQISNRMESVSSTIKLYQALGGGGE